MERNASLKSLSRFRPTGLSSPGHLAAIIILLAATALALARPMIAYDNWSYHFPFSARLWNIGNSNNTFRFSDFLEARWIGFPKLWEWLQGLFWACTGSLRAMIFPQIILCIAYFRYVSRRLKIPASLLVLGFFASPMLMIHYQSLYVDLPAGLCLCLGFFILMKEFDSEERRSLRSSAAGIMFLGLAGNMKVQAMLAVVLFAALFLSLALIQFGISKRSGRIIILVVVGALASSVSVISNSVRTGNPIYPMQVSVHGTTVFDGPEDPRADAHLPGYDLGEQVKVVPPQPIAFVLSATELDWTIRGVSPWYNLDSYSGNSPRRGEPSRTGGWGWLFMFLNSALLIIQLARLRFEKDGEQKRLVICISVLFVATSFLPRSHELRYWLYLPLILLPINIRYCVRRFPAKYLALPLTLVTAYGIAQAVLSPTSHLLVQRPAPPSKAAAIQLPDDLAAGLRTSGRYCADDPLLFRYSTAITGMPAVLSMRPEDCVQGLSAPR